MDIDITILSRAAHELYDARVKVEHAISAINSLISDHAADDGKITEEEKKILTERG